MRIHTALADRPHNRKFDFDETYIPKGIQLFSALTYDIMK